MTLNISPAPSASALVIIGVCKLMNPFLLKNLWIANVKECLILNTDENVLVLNRKCAFSLKNSKLCFFGCNGYLSASALPRINILLARTSTACLLPYEVFNNPLTDKQDPVVICFITSSLIDSLSQTTCRFSIVDPSLREIKKTFLLPLLSVSYTHLTLPTRS